MMDRSTSKPTHQPDCFQENVFAGQFGFDEDAVGGVEVAFEDVGVDGHQQAVRRPHQTLLDSLEHLGFFLQHY